MPPPLFTGVGCESPDGCVLIVSPPRLLPFRVASPDVAAELGFLWLSFDRFPFVFAPVKSTAPPVDGEVSACARAEASAVILWIVRVKERGVRDDRWFREMTQWSSQGNKFPRFDATARAIRARATAEEARARAEWRLRRDLREIGARGGVVPVRCLAFSARTGRRVSL